MNKNNKIQMQIQYKQFDKKYIQKDLLYISKYYPWWMKELITHIPEDRFVLCPLYLDKYNNIEFQIGVTGTCKIGEKYQTAVSREVGEEIGLFNTIKYNEINEIFEKKYGKHIKTFLLKFSNTLPLTKNMKHENFSKPDDKHRKIGCFIHGTHKQLLDYINNDTFFSYTDNDNIIGIGIVNVYDIKQKYLH